MISPTTLYYHTRYVNGEWRGVLDRSVSFKFPVPQNSVFVGKSFSCVLANGILTVDAGSEWDFASGAIDTEDMRIASLAHDAICRMQEAGKLSFRNRRKGDALFRDILKEQGCGWFRRWYSYLAVSLYSYTKK